MYLFQIFLTYIKLGDYTWFLLSRENIVLFSARGLNRCYNDTVASIYAFVGWRTAKAT